MASNRWVAIDPDILTHPLVGAGQSVSPADPTRGSYSRMEAWIWIICNASFADHTVDNRGRKMTLQRGDLLGAWAYLAFTFNWSAKTVRTWVERLIEDKMLERRTLEMQAEAQAYKGNQATILTVCNYGRYQFDRASEGQALSEGNQKGNQNGNQQGNQIPWLSPSEKAEKYVLEQQQRQALGQAEGQPKGQHITRDTHNNNKNTPLPPKGADATEPEFALDGNEPTRKPKRARAKTAPEAKLIDAAIIAYNAAAATYGFAKIETVTPQRIAKLDQRLRDIGGLENFKRALAVIPSSDFLMGRVKPRNGGEAFRLTFERLLSTDSGMGDVLAGLLDKAANGTAQMIGPNGKPWGWWKGREQSLRALPADFWRKLIEETKPNGTWPWWVLTGPPGHDECLVHPEVVRELGLVEIYKGRIIHD